MARNRVNLIELCPQLFFGASRASVDWHKPVGDLPPARIHCDKLPVALYQERLFVHAASGEREIIRHPAKISVGVLTEHLGGIGHDATFV